MTVHRFQEASAAQSRLRLLGRATETVKHLDTASAELIQMQKMNAVGQLASGITHDFRNVLQAIMSGIDLLEARAHDPDQVRRLAASLMRTTEHGVELTGRLLAFARRQDVKPEAVNLPVLLGSAAELLLRTLGSKVRVEVEPPPSGGLWQPIVDPGQLELALLNLGINARDAMSGRGTLRLCARNVGLPEFERRHAASASGDKHRQNERRGPPLLLGCGSYVLLTVSDTGGGMDGETLERATEPFFTTKPAGQGSGLGLPMVYGFVTQHGGALRLRSQLGKGTSVELWLPCAAVRQQASADDFGTASSRRLWEATSGQVGQQRPT